MLGTRGDRVWMVITRHSTPHLWLQESCWGQRRPHPGKPPLLADKTRAGADTFSNIGFPGGVVSTKPPSTSRGEPISYRRSLDLTSSCPAQCRTLSLKGGPPQLPEVTSLHLVLSSQVPDLSLKGGPPQLPEVISPHLVLSSQVPDPPPLATGGHLTSLHLVLSSQVPDLHLQLPEVTSLHVTPSCPVQCRTLHLQLPEVTSLHVTPSCPVQCRTLHLQLPEVTSPHLVLSSQGTGTEGNVTGQETTTPTKGTSASCSAWNTEGAYHYSHARCLRDLGEHCGHKRRPSSGRRSLIAT